MDSRTYQAALKRIDELLGEAEAFRNREAQGCDLFIRLYVASLKQEWEQGETLDEVTGDIRHHLANCGREADLEAALTGEEK